MHDNDSTEKKIEKHSSDIGEGIARSIHTLDVLLLEKMVDSLHETGQYRACRRRTCSSPS